MRHLALKSLAATLVFGVCVLDVVHAATPEGSRDFRDPHPGFARDIAEKWPKTIDEFLAGRYLRRADVVLTSRKNDLTSYLIRTATNSPFSHAALVFTGPQVELGYSSTFVIEAGTGGVDLASIKGYAADKSVFFAIKRLRQPWFDPEKQSRVRGLLLDNIKSEYNYSAILRILREVWFGVERSVRGKEEAIESFRARLWDRPNSFICSGLVQFGFVEAITEYILARKLPPTALNEVVFSKEALSRMIPPENWKDAPEDLIDSVIPEVRRALAADLEATTPEDLAQSDKLEWLYFIQQGMVHRVRSYDDVKRLIK